jgi:hypothetical protein
MYRMTYNSINILLVTKINTKLLLLSVMHATVLHMTTKKHLFTVNTTLFNKQEVLCKYKCYPNPYSLLVSSMNVKHFCTIACLVLSHMIKCFTANKPA